ncbi:MAG: YopX family protein [Ignavibacterium sp.]|nr:YopX family protein [Ignavibacterium sp.]
MITHAWLNENNSQSLQKQLEKELEIVVLSASELNKENRKNQYTLALKLHSSYQTPSLNYYNLYEFLNDEDMAFYLGLTYKEFLDIVSQNGGIQYIMENYYTPEEDEKENVHYSTETWFIEKEHAKNAVKDLIQYRKNKKQMLKNQLFQINDIVNFVPTSVVAKINSIYITNETIFFELHSLNNNLKILATEFQIRHLTKEEHENYKQKNQDYSICSTKKNKFRVFHKKLGVMGDVVGINFESKVVRFRYKKSQFSDFVFDVSDIDDVILMQFTGLYDDTGKEIYEADIVEVRELNIKPHQAVVYFDYMGAWIKSHPLRVQLGLSQIQPLSDYCDYGCGRSMEKGEKVGTCKVIGNIYENSNLIF